VSEALFVSADVEVTLTVVSLCPAMPGDDTGDGNRTQTRKSRRFFDPFERRLAFCESGPSATWTVPTLSLSLNDMAPRPLFGPARKGINVGAIEGSDLFKRVNEG
jgi:hypothetical protein